VRRSLPSWLGPANLVLAACAATLAVLAARCAALLWDLRAHRAEPGETARVAVLAASLLLAALLACAALRLRPGTRTNVALAIGSAAVALYAGELALEAAATRRPGSRPPFSWASAGRERRSR